MAAGRSSAVIKDVVVNLSGRVRQDFAADYAVSVGAAFGAHLVGVAFVYDPVIPDGMLGGIPVDVIEIQREEASKTAKAAVERFEASAKAAAVSRWRPASSKRALVAEQLSSAALRGGLILRS